MHFVFTNLHLFIGFFQLYGRDQPSKEDMLSHALRKKELCESVISVMDRVIPGRFRMRGKIFQYSDSNLDSPF